MAILVWTTLGIAIWHFTVFVPDHFRGGIVGAFVGAFIGSIVTGALWQIATGDSLGTTDILTALAAVPGCIGGLAVVYFMGLRDEERNEPVV